MSKFRDYDKYEVYEDGKIWSYYTNKFLKPQTRKDGYQQVQLSDNKGNKKRYYLHRIVWEAVTGAQIPEGYEINHISENKTENMVSNLELLSHKENLNYGSRNSKITKSMTNNPKISKAVGAFKNGELVMTFKSAREAGRNGFCKSAVVSCCNGKRKTHKGFEWKYLN